MLESNITLTSVKPLPDGNFLIGLSDGEEYVRSLQTLRWEYNGPEHHKAMEAAVEYVRRGEAYTAPKPKAKAKAKAKAKPKAKAQPQSKS